MGPECARYRRSNNGGTWRCCVLRAYLSSIIRNANMHWHRDQVQHVDAQMEASQVIEMTALVASIHLAMPFGYKLGRVEVYLSHK